MTTPWKKRRKKRSLLGLRFPANGVEVQRDAIFAKTIQFFIGLFFSGFVFEFISFYFYGNPLYGFHR